MSRLLSSVGKLYEKFLTIMIKSAFVALAATVVSAGAAVAGPYVNVETNAGFTGSDYNGAVTDFHVGYEGDLGESAGWYIQGGPAIVSVDGEENQTEISGKVGLGADVSERINVYGELAFLTEDQNFDTDDLNTAVKVGVKYSFWYTSYVSQGRDITTLFCA